MGLAVTGSFVYSNISGNTWTFAADYTVNANDTAGNVTTVIAFSDTAGNSLRLLLLQMT